MLDEGEPAPAFWDWRAIMEDLVWDVEVKKWAQERCRSCATRATRWLLTLRPLKKVTVTDALASAMHIGETTMSNQPWTIISDGNGIITERKLGSYSPGQLLNPTITIVINEVNGEFRNIEFKRSLIINDQDYFSFDFDAEFIDFICAFGNSTQLQYHGPNTNDNINHTVARLDLYYKNW